MISVDNLSFKYHRKGKMVFNDLNLKVQPGGIYGLLGKNGSGKSTLLYLISGLLKPMNGEVRIDGRNSFAKDIHTLQDIFLVPEEFELPSLSLKKFVELNTLFYPKFNWDDLNKNLSYFEIDNNIPNLKALSMGQKKKVFMSFALSTNTRYLFMDEPTNGLDIPGKSQFRKFIVSNMNDERTIIISTHQVKDVDKILDTIILLDNSNVLLQEPISDICRKYCFMDTNDEEIQKDALYSTSSLNGYSVLLENKEEKDTELNLELLFNAVISKPELFKNDVVNEKKQKEEEAIR